MINFDLKKRILKSKCKYRNSKGECIYDKYRKPHSCANKFTMYNVFNIATDDLNLCVKFRMIQVLIKILK